MVLFTSVVALSMSVTGASVAHAGVIQRNATSFYRQMLAEQAKQADEQKEEIGTAAKTDENGNTVYVDSNGNVSTSEHKEEIGTAAKTDENGNTVEIDSNGNASVTHQKTDWLGPDGVAKMPSYSDVKVIEENTIDNPDRYSTLLKTEHRTGDFVYPAVNPDTGQPLWSTQPFWRADGTFDLFGYLKQFVPNKDGTEMAIRGEGPLAEGETNRRIPKSFVLNYTHKDVYAFPGGTEQYPDATYPFTLLRVSLVNSTEFNPRPGQHISYEAFYSVNLLDSRFYEGKQIQRFARLNKADLKNPVRLTGSQTSYIYEIQVRQLEEIMRDYLEDPHGYNIKKHPQPENLDHTGIFYWE